MTIWSLLFFVFIFSTGLGQAIEISNVEEQDYLIILKPNRIGTGALQEILEATNAELLIEAAQVGVASIRSADPDALLKLQSFSSVELATRDIEIRSPEIEVHVDRSIEAADAAHDLYDQYQWDIKRVTANGDAWSINRGNHQVVVAVIDTGVDFSHPDLQANLLYGKAFFPGATEADALRDAGTHGTHVAGSIAGNGRILGVGPDLGIASYRVSNNRGGMSWAGILSAITTAADDGVDVANLSLGTYSIMNDEQDRALHLAAMRAVKYANNKGMIIVGANGNDGIDLGKRTHTVPGEGKVYGPLFDTFTSIPGVVSVSSSTNRDTLAYYSNYGSSNVTLAAPGGDAGPNWPNPDGDRSLIEIETRCYSTIPVNRGSYGWAMGTSMAAPKVAAVAALVKAENPKLSNARIVTLLQQTADDLGKKGHDAQFGHGLVNANEALKRAAGNK